MRVGSLFSGIGGLDLGLERAGMSVAWQCEADPYCRAVLRKHWPDVPCYPDVRVLARRITDPHPEPVDLLCGGFPCQPVSQAGNKLAQLDDRWLWPEFARLVRTLRPRYVVVENVPGLLARGMGDVLGDLAACGYDAEWDCIPAAALGALHRRDRAFVVAWCNGIAVDPGCHQLVPLYEYKSGEYLEAYLVDGRGLPSTPSAGVDPERYDNTADKPRCDGIMGGSGVRCDKNLGHKGPCAAFWMAPYRPSSHSQGDADA